MTDYTPYGGHGKGSHSSFTPYGGHGKGKKKHHGGFLHALGTAVRNTGHAIEGIGPGLYTAGESLGSDIYHEIRHPKQAHHYSPFTGDKSKFQKKVIKPVGQSYAYKYGPLVHGDIGKTATRMAEDPVGTIGDIATVATLGTAGATKAGLLSDADRAVVLRSPGARAGQEGKVIEKGIAGTQLSRRLRIAADKQMKKLPPEFPVLGEVARYGKALKARETRQLLHQTLKAQPYLKTERALSREERIAANLIHDYPSRTLLEEYKASLAGKPEAAPTLKLLNNKKVLRYFSEPTKKMQAYLDESGKLGDISTGISGLAPETATARRFQQSLILRGAKMGDEGLTAPEGHTIGGMIDSIKQELAAEGRPEPLYRKHQSVEDMRGTSVAHGGGAPQPAGPPIKQSHATLAAMGRVAYDIDSLTPAYMKVVKWATYTDRHADLLHSGIEVPKGYKLREGEEFLKRKPSEVIPYTERTAGEFERNIEGDLGDHLTTSLESDAAEGPNGTRIVIPSALKKKVVGEYHNSTKAANWFWNKPTAVWRALVLNLSPRWLVNNIVGNTLLYTVRTAGAGGLRAWLQAMSDTRGAEFVKKMVMDKETRSHLTPADMAEVLPEQVKATFFGTQTPSRGLAGKISKYSPTRPLRAADVGYEQALRRAIANQVIRKSPEVKARLAAMPKEAKSWREAAKQELASNPALADRVTAEINNSLGDFTHLTPLEQGVLRGAVPFYAWYRAITLVMLKMPLDNPVRATILYNLGKIGEAEQSDLYPFGGAIGLGGNTILRTNGINPYATVPQVAENVSTLAKGAAGQNIDDFDKAFAAGIFNPLLVGGLVSSYPDILHSLPEYQIYKPRPSKLYSGSDRKRALLNYLGVPIGTVSKSHK